MRRVAALAGLLAFAFLAAWLASAAIAASHAGAQRSAPDPKSGVTFAATSTHKHYIVSIATQCAPGGCKQGEVASIDLTVAGTSGSACPSATDELIGTIADGKLVASEQFYLTASTQGRFRISGTFSSRRALTLTGKIAGPRSCGGTDAFSARAGGH
jgi:hypothetical protein